MITITKAKYQSKDNNWVSLTFDDGSVGQTSTTDGIRRQYSYLYDKYVANGGVTEPYMTPEEIAEKEAQEAYLKWKSDRQVLVDNIEVVYDGHTYQGDEVSQGRMARAILGLPDEVTTIDWVSKDNIIVPLTKVDLQSILAQSGIAQSVIWNDGRP